MSLGETISRASFTYMVLAREYEEAGRNAEPLQSVKDAEGLALDEAVVLAAVCT